MFVRRSDRSSVFRAHVLEEEEEVVAVVQGQQQYMLAADAAIRVFANELGEGC